MIGRRAEPDIHLRARVEIHVGKCHQNGFIVVGTADTLDQRWKIQRHHVELNAEPPQVLLDQGQHALVELVSRIGDHGELHAVAVSIE